MGWRGRANISNVLGFPLETDELVDVDHRHLGLALLRSKSLVVLEEKWWGKPNGEKKVAEKRANTNALRLQFT